MRLVELEDAARRVGLELRLNKCKWAEVRCRDQPATRVSHEHAELSAMPHVLEHAPMLIPGAPVSMTADFDLEFTQIVAKAWQAHHSNAPFWRSRGSLGAKLRVLHFRCTLVPLGPVATGQHTSCSIYARCNSR